MGQPILSAVSLENRAEKWHHSNALVMGANHWRKASGLEIGRFLE